MLFSQANNIVVPDTTVSTSEGLFESLKGLSFDDAIGKIANSIVDFSFRLFIAIVVLYVGKFIIKRLYTTARNVMLARDLDVSLTTFVLSLIKILLYFILIVIIIGILGIETSSFLALFASAGVAIGMALSGTLQNFAGGVLILLLKPYKVGDFIEAQGYTGRVKAIQIFNTTINTPDNKAIIIPNGPLSTSSINNYSLEIYRRVDWTVSLAYGTPLEKACAAIKEILLSDARIVKDELKEDLTARIQEHEKKDTNQFFDKNEECREDNGRRLNLWQRIRCKRRLKKQQSNALNAKVETIGMLDNKIEAAPFVELGELGDSSINITVRAWTLSENYWPVYFEMNKRFYTELPKMGFEFPFPQMDVHINNT